MKIYDVVIIGAGASGLMTAIKLSEGNKSVAVLDGNSKAGKKLLATGNGRCNLCNMNLSVQNFHGDNKYIKSVIEKYPADKIVEEFHKIGIFTMTDSEGRVYPKSLQALAVLKAMTDTLSERKVDIITDFDVENVVKKENKFTAFSADGKKIISKKLVISTGSYASPRLSSKADCYKIAEKLGHSRTKINPVLTRFLTDDKFIKGLSGVRAKCMAKLIADGKEVYSESGEMIFSDKAMSGICLLNLSVHAEKMLNQGKKISISFDYMEDKSEQEIMQILEFIIKNRPNMKCTELLNSVVNMKLGFSIMKKSVSDLSRNINTLNKKDLEKICKNIKNIAINVKSLDDFKDAQVCAGGIPLCEIDINTMQSKICKSLYFTGEILNIHGDCGGYNLYFAWTTGIIAGKGINNEKI